MRLAADGVGDEDQFWSHLLTIQPFFCIYLEPKSSASSVFTTEAEDFMLNEEATKDCVSVRRNQGDRFLIPPAIHDQKLGVG